MYCIELCVYHINMFNKPSNQSWICNRKNIPICSPFLDVIMLFLNAEYVALAPFVLILY